MYGVQAFFLTVAIMFVIVIVKFKLVHKSEALILSLSEEKIKRLTLGFLLHLVITIVGLVVILNYTRSHHLGLGFT